MTEQANNGILNKFRRAYRWYKEHNPSSDTESDESNDEFEEERRKSSVASNPTDQVESQEKPIEASKPVIKSASTESEFKKRFSISASSKGDYLKVPTSEDVSSTPPMAQQSLLPENHEKPKYAPIIYRRRSSIALTK